VNKEVLSGVFIIFQEAIMDKKKKKKSKGKTSLRPLIYIIIIVVGLFVISYTSVYLMAGIIGKGQPGL